MKLHGHPSAPTAAAVSFPLAARLRPPPLAWLLLFLYAASLLTIGITRDWRLLHEDNGALHTSFARTHLDLGLARTRAHDVFFSPRTGAAWFYGHHPPATALALAGAFWLTGSDAPWVARAVAIAFHLASLGIFVALLRLHLPSSLAFAGGVLFATVPMSAYFGRMVNYEALCLTGVLLLLYGHARLASGRPRCGAALVAVGMLLGGLADWPVFFFAAALGLADALAALRGERGAWRRFLLIGGLASAVLALDLAHLAWAAGGLGALVDVLGARQESVVVTPGAFVARELTHLRRYFGHAAMPSGVLLAIALLVRRTPLAATLAAAAQPRVFARWLGASGVAALAYTIAAPSWAMVHAYWSFYFLPFLVTALLLVLVTLAEYGARGGRPGWLAGLAALALVADVGSTAVRTIVKRHRTPEPFAIERTAELRRDNVPARSWAGTAADDDAAR